MYLPEINITVPQYSMICIQLLDIRFGWSGIWITEVQLIQVVMHLSAFVKVLSHYNESDICVQYSLLGSTASALTVECWRVISFIILKFLKELVKSSSRPFFLSLASRSPLILCCNYRNVRSDRYVLSMKQFANVIETVGCHWCWFVTINVSLFLNKGAKFLEVEWQLASII